VETTGGFKTTLKPFKMTTQTINEIVQVPTSKLVFNQTICNIYSTPENYAEIKENIKKYGVIQPLLVNETDFQVISGNLRLKIALELGYQSIPVIFNSLSEGEMQVIALSANQQRVKSPLDKWNERQLIKKIFDIKQGSRTDLNPQLKEESMLRDKMSNGITDYEKSMFSKIEKLAKKLHGDKFNEVIQKELTPSKDGKVSINALNARLTKQVQKKVNSLSVPQTFELKEDDFNVYNQSCENMSQLKDKSVASIVTSPPYFAMRNYGNGVDELGLEKDREDYIDNLINIFKECRRVLKDDGSLMVNINEKVENGAYQGVVHEFAYKMIKSGWRINDEIVWLKANPVHTSGKRTVRSHEHIFHFVKSDATDFYYDEDLVKKFYDNDGSYIYGNGKKVPKFLSGMDFTNGARIKTNVANTGELRNQCSNEGFFLTHSATFPVDVPGLLVLLTSKQGDLVVDPFNGTGTTGEVCKVLGRSYVGYDLNPEFIMATEVRMNNSTLSMNIIHHNFLNNRIKLAV
jgi:site-specific DNA-methyltransferase (adenine-specific)